MGVEFITLVVISAGGQKKIFEVISNVIDEELPSTMTAGINYAASPGVIIPLLMLLG
jgi:hypothetical protein